MKTNVAATLAAVLAAPLLAADGGAGSLPAPGATFMRQYCLDCHDADASKGDLNLADLPFDPASAANVETWQRVFARVRTDEMPPPKKKRPDKDARASFLTGLAEPLALIDRAEIGQYGRVRSRRLTRVEYEHTLHDLLGIDIPLKDLLPEDPSPSGFETVATGQQLSHYQLARYLDVADIALEEAFGRALNGDAVFKRSVTPEDTTRNRGGNYRGPELRGGESVSWPITLQFFGRMQATTVPQNGWYRVTLRGVRCINPGRDGAVWGTLRSGACAADAPLLSMIGLVEATPEPRDMVFEAWMSRGYMLELKPNDAELRRAPTGAKGGNVSFAGRDLAKEGYAGIAHRGIDIERIYPRADRDTVRRRLFGDVDQTDSLHAAAALEGLMERFAVRAFRRPVTTEELSPYVQIGRAALAAGKPLAQAMRAGYLAVLCSPRFLTFVERPGELDDHALASRLSYALWVSMPDAKLSRIADEGGLRRPGVLEAQIERMLADPKSERFIRSFTDQWLKLKEIDFTSPDSRKYRTFDPVLQESMVQETRAFVSELVRSDRGITNLIASDFTFLNGRLARHYGIGTAATAAHGPVVAGRGLQKVSLPPELPRGGLITQGAVLKVTADGSSTSPVVRGVFINERILGRHVPPPPPGVSAIEPDIRGAVSIRDQLDKHRSDASCASCHKVIDPPGFMLENFDPIGGWRVRYGAGNTGAAVDPTGVTPDGLAFSDLRAWQAIYGQRGEQLSAAFLEQFLTYATGAKLRFSDRLVVDTIVQHAQSSNFGVRSMLKAALTSDVFVRK